MNTQKRLQRLEITPFLCCQQIFKTSGKVCIVPVSPSRGSPSRGQQLATTCSHIPYAGVAGVVNSTLVLNQMLITLSQRVTPGLCLALFPKQLGIHNHAPCTPFCPIITSDLGPACHVQPQPSMGGGVKKKKKSKILHSPKA